MTASPNRHWFSFGLRTMFVVVTIFGVWLGWNFHQVRQRTAALQYLSEHASVVTIPSDGQPLKPWKCVPLVWEWMGATPIRTIELGKSRFTEEDQRQLNQLFPEATIVTID